MMDLSSPARSTRLEVDLDRIGRNYETVKAIVSGTNTSVCCVLKGNAYGHGAVEVARELNSRGADTFSVAFLGEALELRRELPEARIFVMGYTESPLLPRAVAAGIELSLFDPAQIPVLEAAAASTGRPAKVHLKLDTGMNRLGMKESDDIPWFVRQLLHARNIKVEGLFTHLALRDRESDRIQAELFFRLAASIQGQGLNIPSVHVCDSIGFLRYPELRLDMVRVGAILFGMKPLQSDPQLEALDIAPCASFKSKIARVRKVRMGECVSYDRSWTAPPEGALVATVSCGYADGYMRCLSNRAHVLVRGHRAPVIGLICMDQMTVDVSGIPDVCTGDDVLLYGSTGGASIPVSEIASLAGTNRNEIMSVIGRRVPRLYFKGYSQVARDDYLDR